MQEWFESQPFIFAFPMRVIVWDPPKGFASVSQVSDREPEIEGPYHSQSFIYQVILLNNNANKIKNKREKQYQNH